MPAQALDRSKACRCVSLKQRGGEAGLADASANISDHFDGKLAIQNTAFMVPATHTRCGRCVMGGARGGPRGSAEELES
jgi:hypothetical protein